MNLRPLAALHRCRLCLGRHPSVNAWARRCEYATFDAYFWGAYRWSLSRTRKVAAFAALRANGLGTAFGLTHAARGESAWELVVRLAQASFPWRLDRCAVLSRKSQQFRATAGVKTGCFGPSRAGRRQGGASVSSLLYSDLAMARRSL